MEKDLFSIKEAAQMAQMTKETLRHYDRIGLVCPTFKNEQTKYRYYTKADIVRLNTVYALQQMDLSLEEIKEALSYNDLEKIILFLNKAEQKAEKKIHSLQYALKKIKLAKDDYEKKRTVPQQSGDFFILELEERTILLSDTLSEPSLDNLWDYLRHFKNLVPPPFERFLYLYGFSRNLYRKQLFPFVCDLRVLSAGKRAENFTERTLFMCRCFR